MRVALGTFHLTDDERRAIREHLTGRPGLATREEVRRFLLATAGSDLATITDWYLEKRRRAEAGTVDPL